MWCKARTSRYPFIPLMYIGFAKGIWVGIELHRKPTSETRVYLQGCVGNSHGRRVGTGVLSPSPGPIVPLSLLRKGLEGCVAVHETTGSMGALLQFSPENSWGRGEILQTRLTPRASARQSPEALGSRRHSGPNVLM